MIRRILTFLTILLVVALGLIKIPCAIAQTQTVPTITEAQLKVGDELARLAIEATEKGEFTLAEKYWSELIEKFPTNPAVWSNRGNSRVSQNKLEAALADFNKAVEIAPNAADPY